MRSFSKIAQIYEIYFNIRPLNCHNHTFRSKSDIPILILMY